MEKTQWKLNFSFKKILNSNSNWITGKRWEIFTLFSIHKQFFLCKSDHVKIENPRIFFFLNFVCNRRTFSTWFFHYWENSSTFFPLFNLILMWNNIFIQFQSRSFLCWFNLIFQYRGFLGKIVEEKNFFLKLIQFSFRGLEERWIEM